MNVVSFESKIRDFIEQNQLLDYSKRYLVALSGGADSVCLLTLLQRFGYAIEAVHCNFHLRGDESDRDEHFCEELCKPKNIPFHRVHFDTKTYSELHHVSIEMAARQLRYNYFKELLQSIGCQSVCVAHHRDDVVETVLMNLIRGTGIHGLTGIAPKAPIPVNNRDLENNENDALFVVRPLLCVSRKEIESYLESIGQTFVTDSSNLEADVVRNKIRLNIIPQLEDILPSASENIASTSHRLLQAEYLFNEGLELYLSRAKLFADQNNKEGESSKLAGSIEGLWTYDLRELFENEYVLFTVLRPFGFQPAQIEDIFRKGIPNTGQKWLSNSYTAVVDRDVLQVFRNDDPRLACHAKEQKLPLEGLYNLGELGNFCVKKEVLGDNQDPMTLVDKSKNVACLDANLVSFPLTLRPLKEGDRFKPYGMKGTKLISDYLTDRKKTVFEKLCQLVLCDESGIIMWLVGERVDDTYAVNAHTRTILYIKKVEK
ncbi:MAG: tRNA lysidine(34) synthetase TilS [Prevotella sp.]|nr:tRNA lysidine(34) synthetase TilS [Prevotella sp.]